MAVQTDYLDRLPVGFAGMISNLEPNFLMSRQVEGAAIPFGRAVKQGTAAYQVAAATAAADVFRGITCRVNSNFAGQADADGYRIADDALIITKGVVWVVAFDTVVAGAPAFMRVDGGLGRFTDTSTNNLPIPDGIFDTGGGAGELVKLRLK